jgi:hypothetical protein
MRSDKIKAKRLKVRMEVGWYDSKDYKDTFNYENNVPRCENCVRYLKPKIILKENSTTTKLAAHCKTERITFQTRPTSVCDNWKGRNGETL